jgi:hypothetical protein
MKMGGFFCIFILNLQTWQAFQSDNSDNLELIAKLAKKLGIQVNDISDELSEDLALGKIMSKSKTGASVSRESVMKKLQS